MRLEVLRSLHIQQHAGAVVDGVDELLDLDRKLAAVAAYHCL